MIRVSNELQIGKAGEYLTCADLIIKGFVAFPSEQGLPYDVVLDNGVRLFRVQVKAVSKPRVVPQRKTTTHSYIFDIKRHGKKNNGVYTCDSIDLFALVCLDTRLVGYTKVSETPTILTLRVDSMRESYYDEKGKQDYAKVMELRETIDNQAEIARQLDMNASVVNRMCKPDYKPFQTSAKYFSDVLREPDWFSSL